MREENNTQFVELDCYGLVSHLDDNTCSRALKFNLYHYVRCLTSVKYPSHHKVSICGDMDSAFKDCDVFFDLADVFEQHVMP